MLTWIIEHPFSLLVLGVPALMIYADIREHGFEQFLKFVGATTIFIGAVLFLYWLGA